MQHIEGEFQGYQGFKLYFQGWLPAGEPRAILLIVHGLAEHSGRFGNLVNYFVPKGYALHAYDQRGHGKTSGRRGYIDKFSYFVEDLGFLLETIHNKHPKSKIFFVAHSIGGTVSTAYATSHQNGYHGLILSAPTLKPGASVPSILIKLAPVLSVLIPRVGLYRIEAEAISSDKAVVDAYIHDPLVNRGKISTRLGVEIIKTMQALPLKMSQIRQPLLIMYGTADKLSEPQGSQLLYQRASSKDKNLKSYPGFYHEIFNEPGREKVFQDMDTWLTAHL